MTGRTSSAVERALRSWPAASLAGRTITEHAKRHGIGVRTLRRVLRAAGYAPMTNGAKG